MPSRNTDAWYRARAKEQFHDEGTFEIDDEAVVSRNDSGDHGAYVQGWCWIADEEKPVFHCNRCGDLEFALLNGYGVGDRVLEGVMFEIRHAPGGTFIAKPQASDADYVKTLNETYWCDAVAASVGEQDTLTCPTCGEDIDGPAA